MTVHTWQALELVRKAVYAYEIDFFDWDTVDDPRPVFDEEYYPSGHVYLCESRADWVLLCQYFEEKGIEYRAIRKVSFPASVYAVWSAEWIHGLD